MVHMFDLQVHHQHSYNNFLQTHHLGTCQGSVHVHEDCVHPSVGKWSQTLSQNISLEILYHTHQHSRSLKWKHNIIKSTGTGLATSQYCAFYPSLILTCSCNWRFLISHLVVPWHVFLLVKFPYWSFSCHVTCSYKMKLSNWSFSSYVI